MGGKSEITGVGNRAVAARQVLANLAEMEPELKDAAIFTEDGLVATNAGPDWIRDAESLIGVAATHASGELDSAHIALNEGEIFLVSEAGYTLIASTGRFVLASLTKFDARMCLRDLAAEHPPEPKTPDSKAGQE